MNKQEVFDKAATHLLTQNERSVGQYGEDGEDGEDGDVGCLYRSSTGLKCAVGCLIPDELYDPVIENIGTLSVFAVPSSRDSIGVYTLRAALVKSGIDVTDQELGKLLGELQHVHDSVALESWHPALAELAKEFGLDPRVLEAPAGTA